MYNEPNGDDIPAAEWLERLRFSSDAVQAAVADVNRIYGKSLVAEVQGPGHRRQPAHVLSRRGAQPAMQSLHTTPLGVVDPNFQLMHTYAYQRYDLIRRLVRQRARRTSRTPSTPTPAARRCGTRLTEFNVHTAGNFDDTIETLDTPSQFSRFGSILAQLANNKPDELYVFKFSQGPGTNPGTVKKNGTHFVDNGNSPYNIGGETKGGDVVRLFAKSFAGANDLFNVPVSLRHRRDRPPPRRLARSRSRTSTTCSPPTKAPPPARLTINLSSWGIAAGARAIVEEVSADRQGEVSQIITVPVERHVQSHAARPKRASGVSFPKRPRHTSARLAPPTMPW